MIFSTKLFTTVGTQTATIFGGNGIFGRQRTHFLWGSCLRYYTYCKLTDTHGYKPGSVYQLKQHFPQFVDVPQPASQSQNYSHFDCCCYYCHRHYRYSRFRKKQDSKQGFLGSCWNRTFYCSAGRPCCSSKNTTKVLKSEGLTAQTSVNISTK